MHDCIQYVWLVFFKNLGTVDLDHAGSVAVLDIPVQMNITP